MNGLYGGPRLCWRCSSRGGLDVLLAEFGLKDSVALIGQQALAKWGYSPQSWVVMGDVLITLADWEGLRDHAVRLRQIVAFREELGGYSWFLDGLAEQQLGHPERAEAAWKTFCDNLPRNEGVALRAAATFSRRDLPRQTFEVLVRLHGRGEPPDAVLVNLQAAAHKLRNLEWFERTSRELFARHPKDPLVMNNFAAALMIQGDRSAEVLPLTLQQLQAMPNAGGAIVNHAFALIQAGRPNEAAPLLARAEGMSLGPAAEEMLRYARVGYHSALGQLAEAKQHAQKLSLDDLYPNQRQQIAALIQPLTAGEP
jgi:Flp pilus assembly protein TadD